MVAESQLTHDAGELLEILLLRREQRVALEEGNDAFEQVFAVTHHKDKRSIASAIRLDVAAPKPRVNQLEYLSPVAVLADVKLGYQLKPDAAGAIVLHRYREASFSVDVTRDVAVQPFLLIVRTRHVVTTVNVRPDVNG